MPLKLRSSKKELAICAGCCCQNNYCAKPLACCANEFSECCCCGYDGFCITCDDRFNAIPGKTCSCLPCCFLYPKFACCTTLKELYVDGDGDGKADTAAEKIAIYGPKAEYFVCCGCCAGICGYSYYCLSPRTCCATELAYCLCCAGDCAFPCVDTVPSYTCGYLGLMCCPKFGCCPIMKEYYNDPSDWDDNQANLENQHAQAAVQAPGGSQA